MTPSRTTECWAVAHRFVTILDGDRRHFDGEPNGTTRTKLFRTRADARSYIREQYGYIARRADLRVEPHCWRVPRAVRVRVVIEVAA